MTTDMAGDRSRSGTTGVMRSRRPRMLELACLVLLCAEVAAPVSAQEAARQDALVLVAREPGTETSLLVGELEALGFRAEVVDEPIADLAALEALAVARDAVAAVRVRRTETAIELWIADRVTEKTVVRAIRPSDDDDPERLVALAAVELLRASFLEIAYPPTPEEAAAPPEVAALARSGTPEPAPVDDPDELASPDMRTPERAAPEPKRFSLSVGPSLVVGPGGVGPSPHVAIAGRGAFSDTLRAGVALSIPVLGGLVEDRGNEADVTVLSIGLDVELLWPWPVTPVFGAGATTLLVWMDGSAVAPYVGQRDFVFSAAFFARAGVRWTALEFLALRADLAIGVAWPTVVVRFADERVADYGLPYFEPSLSAEVLF
jgi:hypothetical protein